MKLFGVIGVWEAVVIVVIIALIFGPSLFKKIGRRVEKTGRAAKKGLENGAKNAGVEIPTTNEDGTKMTAFDHITKVQDKVDDWFEEEKNKPEQEGEKPVAKAINNIQEQVGTWFEDDEEAAEKPADAVAEKATEKPEEKPEV